MKLIGMYDPASFDEVPLTLTPKYGRLCNIDPEEVERIAQKPFRKQRVPECKMHLNHLANYNDVPIERRRQVVSQMIRPVKSPIVDAKVKKEIPANFPQPVGGVPLLLPSIASKETQTGRYLAACLSREEHNLFVETWIEWFKEHHEEYNKIEDRQDVKMIAMETVIQFRLLLRQQISPNAEIENAYNQSCNRLQKARENLTARRLDRVGTKAGKSNQVNVAIWAGQITPEVLEEHRRQASQKRKEVDNFLDGTIKGQHSLPSSSPIQEQEPLPPAEIVEGEIVEEQGEQP